MNNTETIFAISTPIGKSGVAIIRLSGDESHKITSIILGKNLPKPRFAALCKLYDPKNNQLIDNAIVIVFKSPASFTGEDMVEFHIHGSRAVISQILNILSSFALCRPAEPGEFSRRAFYNNKMDLTAAEGLVDLINAETSAQSKIALQQLNGALSNKYEGWRSNLINISAMIEAFIDFPDEDIPESIILQIEEQVKSLEGQIKAHLNDGNTGERLRAGAKCLIIGPPNVGKSTLLNILAKRDVAITSDIAGTTRDLIEVHLDLDGLPLTLIDSAGVRASNDEIEQQGIKRTVNKAKQADLRIFIFDHLPENQSSIPVKRSHQQSVLRKPEITSKPIAHFFEVNDNKLMRGFKNPFTKKNKKNNSASQEEYSLLELIEDNDILVFNKQDKFVFIEEEIRGFLGQKIKNPYITASFMKNEGITEILSCLKTKLDKIFNNISEPLITRERYRASLSDSLTYIESFSLDKDIVLAAEDLRMACYHLGQITGKIGVEDILDKLFSSFCIGK